MTTIERYAEQYPGIWQSADQDYRVFCGMLAEYGHINRADVDPMIWEHEKVHPPAEPPAEPPALPPAPPIAELREKHPEVSEMWPDSDMDFLVSLRSYGYIDDDTYHAAVWEITKREMAAAYMPPEELAALRQEIGSTLFDKIADWFRVAWREFLTAFWSWLKENVAALLDLIWGHIKAAFEQYWPPVKDKIEAAGQQIFDWTTKYLLDGGEVTPERAPAMAAKMLTLALTAGITAHAMSVGFEMIHPFKSLGFHQMTGMVAQLGSFGPVSAATLGQIHYAALRRPMSYAVNKVTRSQLPDDQLLQIMAVKPDIDMSKFVETMKYHGYSDYWIDRIRATMYHEPRYFELKMMSEDLLATEDWLYTKSRRAGFSEADSRIMVSSYLKTASRTQRIDFYRQAFYLFKEGYISRGLFDRYLEELEFRPEAKQFAARAADLAYVLDVTKESISYWTDCYGKDLIDEDELSAHLSLLGVTPSRAWLIRQRARVKKTKRPGQPVKTELQKATSKIQTQYAQAYVTLYRKDLIDADTLIADLIAIGIVPELAEATAALEAVRKLTPATAG